MTPPLELPVCDYRVPTAREDTHFCRHERIHTVGNLVHDTLCRACNRRDEPCDLPRLVPGDPLSPTPASIPASAWQYISSEQLLADTLALAGRLPSDLSAVAGIPRSGLLPATYLATLLHLPLFELCRQGGLRPIGHGLRLENADERGGPLLVIDDSVFSGHAMALARQALRHTHPGQKCLFAALYPRPAATGCVDLYAAAVEDPHLFEWNLFNCNQTSTFGFDLDGVLCQDWQGDEELDPAEYENFLAHAPPRWLPRRQIVPLIVTARLERYRGATEAWLRRHGVRVRELIMGPWETATERRARFDTARFKAEAFAASPCRLFVESDERQARAIFTRTSKPVLCPASRMVFQ